MDITLQTPFSLVIAGPSSSGKTTKLRDILKNKEILFKDIPRRIILFYKVWQPTYDVFQKTGLIDEFYEGVPNQDEADELLKQNQSSCMIFDDLSQDVNSVVEYLFTIGSHHYKCSIILISQNLFQKSPVWRNISLNTHYFILMRNVRDSSIITSLSRQIFPGKRNFLSRVCKYNYS